jgi:hypothetical protein
MTSVADEHLRLNAGYSGGGGEPLEQVREQIGRAAIGQYLLHVLPRNILAKLSLLRIPQAAYLGGAHDGQQIQVVEFRDCLGETELKPFP